MTLKTTITEKVMKRFDEIGFGNQAIIVGTKRKELKEFIYNEIEVALETVRGEVEKMKIVGSADFVVKAITNKTLDQVLSLLDTQEKEKKV